MTKLEIKEGINPKQYFPNEKYMIIYAFTIGDRHYFRFDDPMNTPYDRALKCLVYWKELDMNIDRPFIKAHTEAIDNILSKNKISLKDWITVKQLNDFMKQRLELPKESELMYKMASIVFFDQHESPTVYEFKYGERKIKHWKKDTEVTDFFLSLPLRQLIPYLENAGENLAVFSRMVEKQTKEHLDNLLPLLSDEQKMILQNKFKSFQTM